MKSLLLPTLAILIASEAFAGSATWNLSPTSNDWNTATNWTPATVPNGPNDTAGFAVSNITSISLSAVTEVQEIVFAPGASAFTIAPGIANPSRTLTISGAGITNNSSATQNFVTNSNQVKRGEIDFTNSASAGSGTVITNNGNPANGLSGSITQFLDSASAGGATIINNGSPGNNSGGGSTQFSGNSTADHATIINAAVPNGAPGYVYFLENSTAANATFTNDGSIIFLDASTAENAIFMNGPTGQMDFYTPGSAGTSTFMTQGGKPPFYGSTIHFAGDADHATFVLEGGALPQAGGAVLQIEGGTAGNANVTINPATVAGAFGGSVNFQGTSKGGHSVFTLNGSTVSGAGAATLYFFGSSSAFGVHAENATLIANGGTNGGDGADIEFQGNSKGGAARVEIFGNAQLNLANRPGYPVAFLGSIEGDGQVILGTSTLSVGGNNLNTAFSGVIQDVSPGGSVIKSGTGLWNLSGANSYTGGTTVSQGTLAVTNQTGSATGTGAVSITAGTLGGSGVIGGTVTIGDGIRYGAFLAPALGRNKQSTLTIQGALTIKTYAAYTCSFRANATSFRNDEVIANGITTSGGTFSLRGQSQDPLPLGTVFTVISNTSATPISGTFRNLADGKIVTVNGNKFQANYEGGDGNDLTFTVVP